MKTATRKPGRTLPAYFVSPCDEPTGRSWGVFRRSDGVSVGQGYRTRAEARRAAKKMSVFEPEGAAT